MKTSIETSNKKLEERDDLLRQSEYNPTVINRKWLGDQWCQETYEDVTEMERLREANEQLQKDNIQLKEQIADLWETVLVGGDK